MNRRLMTAGVVGVVTIGGASLYAATLIPGNRVINLGPGPVTEEQIRDRLAASGFSNIQIRPRNIFSAAATRNGRALELTIDPQSGKVIRADGDGMTMMIDRLYGRRGHPSSSPAEPGRGVAWSGVLPNMITGRALYLREAELEAGAARAMVINPRGGPVCPRDLHDNGQAKTGTSGCRCLAAPEPLENPGPILKRHAGPAIANADRPGAIDLDQDLGAWRGVGEGVLNQVP